MLQIKCPFCGVRAEVEFNCGGEGGIARPLQTEGLSDAQWGDYVFMRHNPKGLHHEQWRHASGCGRWFNVLRDTVNYRFVATWRVDEPAPAEAAEAIAHAAAVRPSMTPVAAAAATSTATQAQGARA